RRPPLPLLPLFPYTTLFRSLAGAALAEQVGDFGDHLARIELDHSQIETAGFDLRQIENVVDDPEQRLTRPDEVMDELRLPLVERDRKSTRLNSSHSQISYAV